MSVRRIIEVSLMASAMAIFPVAARAQVAAQTTTPVTSAAAVPIAASTPASDNRAATGPDSIPGYDNHHAELARLSRLHARRYGGLFRRSLLLENAG